MWRRKAFPVDSFPLAQALCSRKWSSVQNLWLIVCLILIFDLCVCVIQENPDSDQSISGDDDFCSDWPKDCVSLIEQGDNKRKLGLQSQFETLRDVDELMRGKKVCSSSSQKNYAGFCLEDEVESCLEDEVESDLSCSQEKGYASDSDVENVQCDEEGNALSEVPIIPGPEKSEEVNCDSSRNEKHYETDIWSAVNKEAEALVRLNENASCSSSRPISSGPIKSSEGTRVKARPKFSFRFPAPKEGHCWTPICMVKDNEPQRSESMEHRVKDDSSYELCDDSLGEEKQLVVLQAEVEGLGHGCVQHSMAELLGSLQDKNNMLQEKFKMHGGTRRKTLQTATKRSMSSLGDRIIDNEDPPEPMGGGSSTDDEAVNQDLKLVIPEKKRQTMVDLFQEVIGAASTNEGSLFALPRPLGIGLFGKLQQVILTEKESDVSFLKRLQAGASPGDEPGCIYVKIMSRYLDAKLTVCHCSLAKNIENLHWIETNTAAVENGGSRQSIIFSPRICSDVELEVGNLIRIHPPWKEVQVMNNDERLILSTYFSQIHFEHFGALPAEQGEQLPKMA